MLLNFRKPRCQIVEKCVSWSGKYFCFLGTHYHQGHTCWVFGISSKEDGEIRMRHYNTEFGAVDPKSQCCTDWRKFKEAMLAKPESEVTEDERIPRPWEKETV